MKKGGYFSFHGGELHNIIIFLSWYKLMRDDWQVTIQDRSFKDKYYAPSIPDIRAVKKDPKITNYIVEVESNLTAVTARKKWVQFVRESHGYDLVILNIDDIPDTDSLKSISRYLEGLLP